MARISGVDSPREKRLEISLTYIFGIGRTTAQQVCDETGISRDTQAIAIVVSQTSGSVRAFRNGKVALELAPRMRRS